MMGDLEATGDVLTGGLVAGAIERERSGGGAAPSQPSRSDHGDAHGLCLNCGTALLGAYCHRCGQAEHIHRSLSGIWHDIAHGVLHFEGKMWNTLPLLAWRPGDLTRRYIHGERARFVSPMALFLFSVFLMFALFSAIGATLKVEGFQEAGTAAAQSEQAADARRELAAELAAIDGQIAAARAARRPTADLERQRRAVAAVGSIAAGEPVEGATKSGISAETGIAAIDAAIAKANKNPNLLLYKVQTNAYKFSWLLIPLSTPLLWLMFAWRRQYRVYDHAVFVTYSLAFMTLFAILLTLASQFGATEGLIAPAAALVPPLHMYRQMRGAYRLGRLNAALRTLALLVCAVITLIVFFTLLLALGAFG